MASNESYESTIDEYINTDNTYTVFKNANVFSNEFVPDRLLFRDDESQFVLSNLTKPFHRIKAQNMFIYGPPGTGKTAMLIKTSSALNRKAKEKGQKIRYNYINVKYQTLPQVMRDIVKQYKPFEKPRGLGFDDYKTIIESRLKDNYTGFIFDDLDKMISKYPYVHPMDILINTFSRLAELDIKAFICVLVNDATIEERLKPSTRSAYAPQYLNFRAYNSRELCAILKDRCIEGLKKDTYNEQTINDFGAFLYKSHRDLRTGFNVILETGHQAGMANKTKITHSDLKKSLKKVEQNTLAELITKFDGTILTFLYAIASIQRKYKEAESKAAYDFYCKEITKLNIDPCADTHLLRSIRPQLEVMGLIIHSIKGRGKNKGVIGTLYIKEKELDYIYDICKNELQKRVRKLERTKEPKKHYKQKNF